MKTQRSRGGCWTCRKRRQKCDEAKPSCGNCRLRNVECGGYGIRLADFTAFNGSSGQMVSKIVRGGPTQPLYASQKDWRPRSRRRVRDSKKAPKQPLNANKENEVAPRTSLVDDSLTDFQSQHASESCPTESPQDNTSNESPEEHPLRPFPSRATDVEEAPPSPPVVRGRSLSTNQFSWPLNSRLEEFISEYGNVCQLDSGLPLEDVGYGEVWTQSTKPEVISPEDVVGRFMGLFPSMARPRDVLELQQVDPSPINQDTSEQLGDVGCDDPFQPYDEEDDAEDDNDTSNGQDILALINEPLLYEQPSEPFDQYLLSHFMNSLSPRLYPVGVDRNPYRMVYGDLATASLPLRNAILFASALHLTKLGQLPNTAIKTYRTSIRDSFREALHKDDQTWGLAATVLLSVVFDVIGTGMDAWCSKLIGCRRLLEKGIQKSEGKLSAGMQCVMLQYNWMSTMGRTLLMGTQPSTSFNELSFIDEASIPNSNKTVDMPTQQRHWWANMPDFSMHLLLREAADLSAVVERLRSLPNSSTELLQLMPRVADLLGQIRDWCPESSSMPPEWLESETHFNCVWRNGLLCYVYHEVCALDSQDPRIQECVEASLESFRNLSWLQAALWPVFMIAVHAQNEEARACFEAGLRKMNMSLGFTAPLAMVGILKRIWHDLDGDILGLRRWKDVIKDLGVQLNVLL